MAYTAWSVVFGEQPTAAKWNQLGQNDAGFKDGSNIDNDAILNRHIADNAVGAPQIASGAIYLGQAQRSTDATSTSTTEAEFLALTVTIPAGGRDLLLMLTMPYVYHSAAGGYTEGNIWDGSVGGGTVITFWGVQGNMSVPVTRFVVVPAPAAGSKTYRVGLRNATGSGTSTVQGSAATKRYPTLMAMMI